MDEHIGGEIKIWIYDDGTPGWRQVTAEEKLLRILRENGLKPLKKEKIAPKKEEGESEPESEFHCPCCHEGDSIICKDHCVILRKKETKEKLEANWHKDD